MRVRLAFSTLACALLLATSVRAQPAPTPTPAPPPAPAAADAPKPLAESLAGSAKADYVGGRTLFDDGDFAGALVKYQSAYDTSKDPRLFWNLGACNKGLRKYAQAIRDLERYKAEGGPSITDKDRTDADEIMGALRPYVAPVSVVANEGDATVILDDKPVGKTPLFNFLVDLGTHRIVIRKEGFSDDSRPLEVKGTDKVMLESRLVAAKHEGRLLVHAGAQDSIALDGQPVGTGAFEGSVASGVHVVRVTGKGKRTREQHVAIEDDQTRTVDITLDSTSTSPWVWIGAGAAAVAAITVVSVIAFAGGSESQSQSVVNGTMPPGVVHLPSFQPPFR